MKTAEGEALARAKRSLSGAAVELGPVPFGDYFLLKKLGEGGMGEVFLAKAGAVADIEKLLVVKTLREQHTEDAEYVRRFIDEARIVVQLSHRNICPVFDVGKVSGQYYLAMEHIHGRDLKTLAERAQQREQPLPPEVAVFIIGEVLEALDYAHRLSDPGTGAALELVHRDVSPHNVMVNFEGEAKLIDFGLAASRLKVERTKPDVVMGKMAYMPPEQARGDAVDGRIDQFAAAVMLYELLAGQRYYEGMGFQDVFAIVGGNTPDGREYRPAGFASLDPGMQAILDRALRRAPEERYAGCAELKDALDNWLLDHRLRAGTRQVRKAMLACFEDELAAERELFAAAQKVKTRSNPVAAGPKLDDSQHTVRIAHDPTMFDSASVPTAEGVFASSVDPDGDTLPSPPSGAPRHEATEHVSRAPGGGAPAAPRRGALPALLLVAGGVLVVAAVAAVALGLWAGNALQGSRAAPRTVSVDPVDPTPVPEPEAAVAPASPPEPDPASAGDELGESPQPTGKSKPAGAPSKRRPRDAGRRPSGGKPTSQVPASATSITLPSADPTTMSEFKAFYAPLAHCGCAANVRAKAATIHLENTLLRGKWLRDARACAKSCRPADAN